jgi:hypothetical protein
MLFYRYSNFTAIDLIFRKVEREISVILVSESQIFNPNTLKFNSYIPFVSLLIGRTQPLYSILTICVRACVTLLSPTPQYCAISSSLIYS